MAEKETVRFYLDVCCLNRPFDDQGQDRIRSETEAVIRILEVARSHNWKWVSSRVVDLEVMHIFDSGRRRRIQLMLQDCDEWIPVTPADGERAKELMTWGIGDFDALHLACAERGGATVFLTTDDRLVKYANRHADELGIEVDNVSMWSVRAIYGDWS